MHRIYVFSNTKDKKVFFFDISISIIAQTSILIEELHKNDLLGIQVLTCQVQI